MKSQTDEFAHDIIKTISRLERQRRRYMDQCLRPHKLQGSMFIIALFMDRNPGSSQEELSDFLGLDKSNVARKCSQMENLGVIRREQSAQDRRQNKLYLTESGKNLLPEIRANLSRWREIVMNGINKEDQKILLSLLEHMMGNFAAYAQKDK